MRDSSSSHHWAWGIFTKGEHLSSENRCLRIALGRPWCLQAAFPPWSPCPRISVGMTIQYRRTPSAGMFCRHWHSQDVKWHSQNSSLQVGEICSLHSLAGEGNRTQLRTLFIYFTFFFFFFFFGLFRAAPMAHRGPQTRGRIGAVAAGQSHSSTRSELCLRPTPQLTATPDPWPAEQGQGLNPQPHGSQSDSFPLRHDGNSLRTSLKSMRRKWPLSLILSRKTNPHAYPERESKCFWLPSICIALGSMRQRLRSTGRLTTSGGEFSHSGNFPSLILPETHLAPWPSLPTKTCLCPLYKPHWYYIPSAL